ncbi:sigma 54-interacting transcriptional regulator [Enterococcus saccharolyticus]|uniref:Transcription antiterminator BglG n=1 Tax=Candidatus Enterococcus willemsii TaxID=1857215 RepID=A0ABQ6YVE9_9ENTE|nr:MULTISPECIES: sigma 54-interacting transcriptional regulator [Enterococcus]KAF1301057.1 transcription antiterminator BglG [Enterococcus sp. CU12B]MCD5001136.1 sigma 54-interacting transcriptional regulator [Enterococcus saccharolyticus]
MKKSIEAYLFQLTSQLNKVNRNEFSAHALSEKVGLNRSTVSSYLNTGFRKGILLKIKTYPVSFLHKQAFQENYFEVSKNEYDSFEELFAENQTQLVTIDPLEQVIGATGSLREKINQIKTAIMYPNGGLPIMLLGSSGSGKTFLASEIYEYAVAKNILPSDAPYISHNCAQYYNNPELLSSVLFGHTKGAFTGAETDREGLLDIADGGILFLDEVHRLSDEGQEKLFTFMDTGEYSPIGDNSIKKRATIRLIFATTEDIQSSFLPTFLRRLPVIVHLPSFHERPQAERLQLIDQFFIQESNILQRRVSVSSKVLHFLLDANLEGNVGKIKNIIKFACGNAYSKQWQNEEIVVRLTDIPVEHLMHPFSSGKMINNQKNMKQRKYLPNTTYQSNLETEERKRVKTFFNRLLDDFQKIDAHQLSAEQFILFATESVILLMDEFVFYTPDDKETSFFSYMIHNIRSTFQFMNENYGFNQDGNKVLSIANYLYAKENQDFLTNHPKWENLRVPLFQFLEESMKDELWLAKRFLNYLSIQMDSEFLDEDIVFIAFYLKSMNLSSIESEIKAVVLAHGYSTASSMANVANRMLQKNIFQAYDMPLGITIDEIEKKVLQYMESYRVDEGLILMVDMGSLNIVAQHLANKIQGPLLIIDSFNTPLLLEVGNLLLQHATIFEIHDKIMDTLQIKKQMAMPKVNKKKAIITCCYTGMGSAIQIKEIMKKSLGNASNMLTILPYDYQKLKDHKSYELPFQMYDILAIVGTENPELENVPYFGLDKLVNGEMIDGLVDLLSDYFEVDIEKLKQELIFNFSLRKMVETLTILDADRVLHSVREAIDELERSLEWSFDANRKYLLYLHVSCMIERLLRKEEVDDQEDIESYKRQHWGTMEKIHRSFQQIEKEYTITISDLELRLLNDIVLN